MKINTEGFTDKDSNRPEYRSLYEQTDNYLEAYSKHTDLRIINDGPDLAIGGDWEEHGPLQLEFLIERGLKRNSLLLDFGCGTGRFARHAVPFLNDQCYIGIDISRGALDNALKLSDSEGWGGKAPVFIHGDGSLKQVKHLKFDFIWLHSVFTHLPPEIIRSILSDLSEMEFGEFLFTYKRRETPRRTGLKQYGYPPEWFISECQNLGLKAETLEKQWPQGQSCMRVIRG